MRTRFVALLAACALAGCFGVEVPSDPPLGGFQVTVNGVYQAGSTIPARLTQLCLDAHNGDVDPALWGTAECPYELRTDEVDFSLSIQALDRAGQPLTNLNRPVAFRVIPGDLAPNYALRWTSLAGGRANATVRASHVYSQVRIWVEDGPPQPIFDGFGNLITSGLPNEDGLDGFGRTYASGTSEIIHFEYPSLAKLQLVETLNNRSSPFVGQFVTIGRPPVAGEQLLHSCPDDPERNGTPFALVVTGIDGSGFFVTDLNSCRMNERLSAGEAIPEPDGKFPGTFGSAYVYNYNHPDGLDQGDLLFSLSGAVQEFTSTTQIVFPSWNIAEKVRYLPHDQWNKYLDRVPIHDVSLRTCGLTASPFIYDTLCAHSTRSLKVESLESSLVRLRNVKLPDTFAPCDKNADGRVEFFCDYRDGDERHWGMCGTFAPPSGPLAEEVQCYIDCTNSLGPYVQTVCTEKTAFDSFGQLTVEHAGPGPAAAGLDDTVPGRLQTLTATGATSARSAAFPVDSQVRVFCDGAVHLTTGAGDSVATTADPLLAANTLAEPFIPSGHSTVAILSASGDAVTCTLARNTRTRALVVLKDVAPDLNLQCDPDATGEAGTQCRSLRAARFDITGHLRQVQPARPRWMVMPRDLDDVCCHPGEGMQCPTPVAPCAG